MIDSSAALENLKEALKRDVILEIEDSAEYAEKLDAIYTKAIKTLDSVAGIGKSGEILLFVFLDAELGEGVNIDLNKKILSESIDNDPEYKAMMADNLIKLAEQVRNC